MIDTKKIEERELPAGDGLYMAINILARRARELNRRRANTGLYDEEMPDPVDVAVNEYQNDLLEFEFRHHLTGSGEDYRSNN